MKCPFFHVYPHQAVASFLTDELGYTAEGAAPLSADDIVVSAGVTAVRGGTRVVLHTSRDAVARASNPARRALLGELVASVLLSHARAHTHMHMHTHALAHTHAPLLTNSLSLSLSLALTLTHSLSLTHSLTHSHSLTLALALCLTLTLSHSLTLSFSLALSHSLCAVVRACVRTCVP